MPRLAWLLLALALFIGFGLVPVLIGYRRTGERNPLRAWRAGRIDRIALSGRQRLAYAIFMGCGFFSEVTAFTFALYGTQQWQRKLVSWFVVSIVWTAFMLRTAWSRRAPNAR